ncbi:MAG: hypothetical protein DRN09_00320 [Thermoplasmata archaeon]|nr:MAG: hypothetical protein DRN09_00320 [Thermoplasmata archaeon]HDD57153.1 hypothetical protein [Thermoplasmatales archaeon]
MRRINITILFDSPDDREVVVKSLEPEVKKKIPKTKISLEHSDRELTLVISAEDTSSLRAACNSYLRWINTAISVKKVL